MNYLATLHDKDIFPQPINKIPDYYEKRVTVKAIAKNKKGQFAFVTNPIHKFCLLAGGGVENTNLEAEIKRECLEELRYEVDVVDIVGKIHEFRNRDAKEYETTCFLVETKNEINEDLRTDDEKKNDLFVVWLDGEEAKKILEEQIVKVKNGEMVFYNTAFNAVRDKIFFEAIYGKEGV
ncbi:MAG: NUDIX domain-containing protein [Candidatus Paceibacterota bacterium]|jgi:hypothetical protein